MVSWAANMKILKCVLLELPLFTQLKKRFLLEQETSLKSEIMESSVDSEMEVINQMDGVMIMKYASAAIQIKNSVHPYYYKFHKFFFSHLFQRYYVICNFYL